ncbi:MAG: c-type cytochrome [Hyphomicrobiaceae bacterium]|nr:c-type cytochrome [Hyphomicrobiaceae bacterium]
MTGHGGPVRAVAALEPGGALVTGGFDSAIIVWSLGPSPVARTVLRHHDSTVNALAALPGGCFASGGEDGRIALWCGGSTEPVRVLSGHTAPVAALAASPSGNLLASGAWDHTVRLWPLAETSSRSTPTSPVVDGHRGPVNGLTFTPDGNALVTAGYDGQLRVTPLTDGAPRADGKALSVQNEAPVNAVAVFRNGRIVSASADGKLRFYDPTLLEIGTLDLANGPLTTVAVSPDGSRIVTAGMRTPVTIVDARTLTATTEILGPGLPVWSVAFSGDGRTLITGGADRAVRRWDPKTGQPAGTDIAGAFEDATASDPHPGAKVFRACKACHGLTEGDVRAGPTLYGIMGRKVGTEPGYAYSEALKTRDIIWSSDTVAKLFEVGPNAYLPGTKMPEQTITNPEDRKALVDWLTAKTGK